MNNAQLLKQKIEQSLKMDRKAEDLAHELVNNLKDEGYGDHPLAEIAGRLLDAIKAEVAVGVKGVSDLQECKYDHESLVVLLKVMQATNERNRVKRELFDAIAEMAKSNTLEENNNGEAAAIVAVFFLQINITQREFNNSIKSDD